jgi:hypothetical protein
MTDDSPPEEPVTQPGSPGFPFGMDPRDRPRERFPEWVYGLPYLSLILLSLYLYFYRHYAWVLLAAAIALLLINPLAARVFVVGWCVLTVAYLVGLGAYLLAVRVIQGH